MYGTVARFHLAAGQDARLMETLAKWRRAGKPDARGLLGDYILKPARSPGEWIVMAIFDNEDNFHRNAADPEQHRQYLEIRALLAADPEWNDGEIVAVEPSPTPI